eukprot:CAMPEP_0173447836 /NCGR_PEP_ID=MMETSP1357-20121228/39524_1 /TAXON_ID=77926 /ORGANISM="Hemiselmis rufescens, Strain PCC563" /LENGTH=175 /DNA_ID=CAMNT_0014414255 /DNA_START=117 /DNA_END=641 /DNA_ORIENTATION=+
MAQEGDWLASVLSYCSLNSQRGDAGSRIMQPSSNLPPVVDGAREEMARMCHSMEGSFKSKGAKQKSSRHWESSVASVKGPLALRHGGHSTSFDAGSSSLSVLSESGEGADKSLSVNVSSSPVNVSCSPSSLQSPEGEPGGMSPWEGVPSSATPKTRRTPRSPATSLGKAKSPGSS